MREFLFNVVSAIVIGLLIMTLFVFSVEHSKLGNNQKHFAGNHTACKHSK